MAFQLVRAGDDDIAVWHEDHGHIYVFAVDPTGLRPIVVRDAPDADAPAAAFADEALRFATREAELRHLFGAPHGVLAAR